MNRHAYFKTTKNLTKKIHNGNYIRKSQLNFFITVIERADQYSFDGYIDGAHQNFAQIFKTPSQFSVAKKDLVERKILVLRKGQKKYGKGKNKRIVESKRYNQLAINYNFSEWLPFDEHGNIARQAIMPSSLKARLNKLEYESNPILNPLSGKSHSPVMVHIANLSKLFVEHYVPLYGLRFATEQIDTLNPKRVLDIENEKDMNRLLYPLFNNEQAKKIGMQREVFKQRHTTIYGDFVNMDKAYLSSCLGLESADLLTSVIYAHRNRIYNMDENYLRIERVRRNIRHTLLQYRQAIITGEGKTYTPIMNGATHTTNKSLRKNMRNITECVVRDIKIPTDSYPEIEWEFTEKGLRYPTQINAAPVQVSKNGKVYKTFSSDIVDKIIMQAQKANHIKHLNQYECNQAEEMDMLYPEYMRPFNPDYKFQPIIEKNTPKFAEDFFNMHLINVVRLFDANLISEDDFEIGLQYLLDIAMKLPMANPAKEIVIEDYLAHVKTSYSQVKMVHSIFGYDRLTHSQYKKLFTVESHNTAFNVFKGQDFTANHYSKRISEILRNKDRKAYLDPFDTYINKVGTPTFTKNEPISVDIDESYLDYLMNQTKESQEVINEVYSAADFDLSYEDHKKIHFDAPPPIE